MLCLFGHKWNGCTCERCGKARDEQHVWDICVCIKCGKARDAEHLWRSEADADGANNDMQIWMRERGYEPSFHQKVQNEDAFECRASCARCGTHYAGAHELNGCTCFRCNTDFHDWQGCRCSNCSETRHRWRGCTCERCGETVERWHEWIGNKCTTCGKMRSEKEVIEAEETIAYEIIHANTFPVHPRERRAFAESNEKQVRNLTVESVLLDIAINARSLTLQEIAAMKLTDERLIAEYIISEKYNDLTTYRRSVRWTLLEKIKDKQVLRDIAARALFDRFRWKACKLSGEHVYDDMVVNKCKCTICGFQEHKGSSESGKAWQCECCGGTVETVPFVAGYPQATIRFSDGTSDSLSGYTGILTCECDLS